MTPRELHAAYRRVHGTVPTSVSEFVVRIERGRECGPRSGWQVDVLHRGRWIGGEWTPGSRHYDVPQAAIRIIHKALSPQQEQASP